MGRLSSGVPKLAGFWPTQGMKIIAAVLETLGLEHFVGPFAPQTLSRPREQRANASGSFIHRAGLSKHCTRR